MAVPSDVEVIISPVEEFAKNYSYSNRNGGKKTIVLFSRIADASRAYHLGFHFDKLNIGNIYNENYKLCCAPSVFLCTDEIRIIEKLIKAEGVAIELKRVPRDRAIEFEKVLKEYNKKSPEKAGI
jgi:PTS system mannose-specific IIB component